MLITHTFINCIHCDAELEVFDEDREDGQVDCPHCGYSNELRDNRLEIWHSDY